MRSHSRRQFLALAIGAGGSLGLGLTACLRSKPGSPPYPEVAATPSGHRRLQSVTRDGWAFGSKVSMTVLHESCQVARRAAAAAMSELELVEELMSLYRPESPLCRLNRCGVLDDPHPYLADVLGAATAMSSRTAGAFDVTVQPLWTVYAEAKASGRAPQAAALEAAMEKVDWRRLEISPQRIRRRGDGTAVTLNGIAQGFAADRAMAALRRHGIRHALVNTGEIGTLAGKGGGEPWTVGIQHPRQADAYLSLTELQGRCLATSGDYATSFSQDRRDHHVFDPHSGRSPKAFSSVSVVAKTATQADALSTAAFVLGPEEGLRLVRSTPGADALFVFKDGRTLATEGFPSSV